MNDLEPIDQPREHIGADEIEIVPDDFAMVDIVYDSSGLDNMLHSYAMNKEQGQTREIEGTLSHLGETVARIATSHGNIDIDLIRQVFERTYDSMEHAAQQKRGPLPPRTLLEKRLIKAGITKPKYPQFFSRLDDRFWDQQFMEQYNEQTWERREPDEDETHYLGRYIAGTLYRFPWANYSYI